MCICDICFDAFKYITPEEISILNQPYREIITMKDFIMILESNLDQISVSRCNMIFKEIKNLRNSIQNIKETYN